MFLSKPQTSHLYCNLETVLKCRSSFMQKVLGAKNYSCCFFSERFVRWFHDTTFFSTCIQDDSQPFHSTKLARAYEVQPLFDISVSAEPSQLEEYAYILDVSMTNVSQTISLDLTQITSLSPQWVCDSLSDSIL